MSRNYGKITENEDGYIIPVGGLGIGHNRMIVYLHQDLPNILLNDGDDIASVTAPQWLYDAIVEAVKNQLVIESE